MPPGIAALPIGKQWVLPSLPLWKVNVETGGWAPSHVLCQRFPSGWARVRATHEVFLPERGGQFELRSGQLVRVLDRPAPPGDVWLQVGVNYVSFPVEGLEPAEPPPTVWERLVRNEL